MKWLPIHPTPDPDYGLPIPRSSHGLSFLKERNSVILFDGEHIVRRRPIGMNNFCWECSLGAYSSLSLNIPFVPREYDAEWRRVDFRDINAPEHIPSQRLGAAQAVDGDGYLYLFGGYSDSPGTELNDFWRLDTKDWIWQRVRVNFVGSDSIPVPRSHATLRFSRDGQSLYLFGGSRHSDTLLDLHRLDLPNRMWQFFWVCTARDAVRPLIAHRRWTAIRRAVDGRHLGLSRL